MLYQLLSEYESGVFIGEKRPVNTCATLAYIKPVFKAFVICHIRDT